jgi:hypothetical protein
MVLTVATLKEQEKARGLAVQGCPSVLAYSHSYKRSAMSRSSNSKPCWAGQEDSGYEVTPAACVDTKRSILEDSGKMEGCRFRGGNELRTS